MSRRYLPELVAAAVIVVALVLLVLGEPVEGVG